MSVTALGGSVTSGNGAYARKEEDKTLSVGYVRRFELFLQAVSPGAAHVVKNSALSGVTSGVPGAPSTGGCRATVFLEGRSWLPRVAWAHAWAGWRLLLLSWQRCRTTCCSLLACSCPSRLR